MKLNPLLLPHFLMWWDSRESCWLISSEVLHVAGRCAMNYPVSCTCMINESPFSTPHSSAPPVAISLLEPCVKGMKEGKEAGKPQGKEFVAKKKKGRKASSNATAPRAGQMFAHLFRHSSSFIYLFIYIFIYIFIYFYIFIHTYLYIYLYIYFLSHCKWQS